jgi:signal peptidase I
MASSDRSTVAFILSLLQPGAGHFLVGRFRRGIAWAAAGTVVLAVMLSTMHMNGWTLLVGMLLSFGFRVASAVDAGTGTPGRPRWALVLGAWVALIAGEVIFSPAQGVLADYYGANRAKAFTIPSGSMLNTLLIGDYILVDRGAYRAGDPQRGDIVVFLYPRNEERRFIHRIIGVPGETLQVRGREVLIDGRVIDEPYTLFGGPGRRQGFATTAGTCAYPYGCDPIVIPPDSYFVMGDNRDNSQDSRYWGFVERDKIIGKASVVYWSWDGDRHWLRWDRLGHRIS